MSHPPADDRKTVTRANRAAWQEAASRHAARNQARLLEEIAGGGYNHLEDHMIALLERIGIAGKSMVQVCCNNGIDLISAKNMGAGQCLGIDQAPAFLDQARELAAAAGHEGSLRFMEADIYDLPSGMGGSFDVAMTTVGVLPWMPDLDGFFAAVSRLIKPGGYWAMEDMHPVLFMYEEGRDGAASSLKYSYFRTEPWIDTGGLDYFGGETYDAEPSYLFMHKMSDVLNAGVASGLEFTTMTEVAHNISNVCADLENAEANPPLGYAALWRKSAA